MRLGEKTEGSRMTTNNKRIQVSFDELQEAGTEAGVSAEQSEQMWKRLAAVQPAVPAGSGFAQVAWYFGAALTIVAMGWLLERVTVTSGAGGALFLSALYGVGFGFFADRLAEQPAMRIASGLLYTLAALMTPFAVSALLILVASGHDYRLGALAVSLATMVVSNVLTARSRISFVCLPALLAGAAAAVIVGELISDSGWSALYSEWALVAYGVVVTFASLIIDRRSSEDYSFWSYGVGALSFWVGLTALVSSNGGWALYALVGLASMFVSVLLARAVFAITGGLAVIAYFTHLAFTLFENSTAFFFVVGALGLLTMAAGVLYVRNAERIQKTALKMVPRGMRRGLPGDKPEDK
jgi:hypothetical protein